MTPPDDINARISWQLRDLAAVQSSRQKTFGYKRAASAVFWLDEPITEIWNDGLSKRVPGIGPASSRVIQEMLDTGLSRTVEEAIDSAGKRADIRRRRDLRGHFFSRAAVLQILSDPAIGGPVPSGYRGDLQMHSEWSDGSGTVREIADACIARGYRFAAVTDHSHGLRIAGGMSMEDAAAQQREIDRVNAELTGFHVFKGIEANIAVDGSLDLSGEEAQQFEVVLAAPHSKLRIAEDQTARLIRAIELPNTHVLAHPRGRMIGSRAGITADWDRVFAAAAAAGVAVEIDGDPARQDIDYDLAGRAERSGCLFALDSDAHTPGQLKYADTALAHARLARIPADRIVNYWELDRLRAWLVDRRHETG